MALHLIRHADAGSAPGEESSLSDAGRRRAERIADLLAGAGITRVLSSRFTRCVETVAPLAERLGVEVERHPALSEEADLDDAWALVESLVAVDAVVCSHGPVLSPVLDRVLRRGADIQGEWSCRKGSVWRLHADGERPFTRGPAAVTPDEVVSFIAACQADPATRCTYVGTETDGIRAELDGLSPPWTETLRVVQGGVSIVEWDAELGRAWVLGPWVDDWSTAGELLDAALAQVPVDVTRYELAGDIANLRLARLAADRGWTATEPNHVLLADADVVAGWPDPDPGFRAAVPADIDAIAVLHDAEFPGTFASAAQLVEGARTTIVAEQDGRLVGYAAGEVHEDGEGFLDFLAVDPAVRRAGLGRQLVVAITRLLVAESPLGRVGLTVQDHRAPARALYERLGFRPDGILVAYRNWR